MTAPALVLMANGTSDDHVAQVVHTLRKRMQVLRPGLCVQLAFVEHGDPSCGQVAPALTALEMHEAVLVPLDITHVYRPGQSTIDVFTSVKDRFRNIAWRLARPLGPAVELLTVVDLRLRQALSAAHASELDALVFSAADSGDTRGNALLHRRARQWRSHHKLPVQLAFADGSGQSISSAVASLRAQGRRSIAVGFFHIDADDVYVSQANQALEAGAIAVSAPIGDDSRLLDLAMARYSVAALDLLDDMTPADLAFDDVPDLVVSPAIGLVEAINF